MQYTLGQAKKRLAASASAYGQDDLRDLINAAIQALAGMTGWECLRKVLRFQLGTERQRLRAAHADGDIRRAAAGGGPIDLRLGSRASLGGHFNDQISDSVTHHFLEIFPFSPQ